MLSFKAHASLDLYLWLFENPILEIQVQERVGEFEARWCGQLNQTYALVSNILP